MRNMSNSESDFQPRRRKCGRLTALSVNDLDLIRQKYHEGATIRTLCSEFKIGQDRVRVIVNSSDDTEARGFKDPVVSPQIPEYLEQFVQQEVRVGAIVDKEDRTEVRPRHMLKLAHH